MALSCRDRGGRSLAGILRLGLAAVLILGAACSDNLTSLEELSGGGDPFAFPDEEIDAAIAEARETDPSEIRAGSDEAAAEAIAAELEAAGVDLTGVDLSVWPLLGDGSTLLVLSVTEDTPAVSGEPTGEASGDLETLFASLVNGTAAADAGIARLAIRFKGKVEREPTEVVITLAMSDIEQGVRTGADVFDRALIQVKSGPDV